MLAKERQSFILERVRERGAVRVSDLTRRARGVRHDGASRPRGAGQPGPAGQGARRRDRAGSHQHRRARASRRSRPGSAPRRTPSPGSPPRWCARAAPSGLSAGTTTWTLARQLLEVPGITVVTNSVQIATVFYQAPRPDQTIVLTGGVRTPSDALVGPVAVAALRSLNLDIVFLGVHGMDDRTGFTSPNLLEAETSRALAQSARRLVRRRRPHQVGRGRHQHDRDAGRGRRPHHRRAAGPRGRGGARASTSARSCSRRAVAHRSPATSREAHVHQARRRPRAHLLRQRRDRGHHRPQRDRRPARPRADRDRRRRSATTPCSTSGSRSPRTGRAAPTCRRPTSARSARRGRPAHRGAGLRLRRRRLREPVPVLRRGRRPRLRGGRRAPGRPRPVRGRLLHQRPRRRRSASSRPSGSALVLDAWIDRTAALAELPSVEQVFCFENRGEEIGVTLGHPHGQIYGYPFVTPRTRTMLEAARRAPRAHRARRVRRPGWPPSWPTGRGS